MFLALISAGTEAQRRVFPRARPAVRAQRAVAPIDEGDP